MQCNLIDSEAFIPLELSFWLGKLIQVPIVIKTPGAKMCSQLKSCNCVKGIGMTEVFQRVKYAPCES